MEEGAAGAAEAFRHLDAHHAELEQLLDELGRELRVLVHVAGERADLPVRELIHAVAKNRFVFSQPRQRGHGGHCLAHEILKQAGLRPPLRSRIVRTRPNPGGKRQCYHRHDEHAHHRHRAFLIASALVLTGLAGMRAQRPLRRQPPAAPAARSTARSAAADAEQPIFRGGINTVRVDVIVTDRQGNPVSDLKLEDFEIQEDGKPQKPETFRLVKIDTVTQPRHAARAAHAQRRRDGAADENARIFAFFLDDYHVMRDSSMSLKKPVIDFIANQLAPGDLATVMYPLTPVDAAVLTRNHQGIINTVEKFEGRKYNYEPMNGVEQGYVFKLTPDAIEIIRRQVTLSAIRGLCTKLGSLREGRKSLILISEGFNATLPPQMRSNQPGGLVGTTGTIGADPFAADNNIMEDRAQFSAGMELQREMQDVWDSCNRNNTAIYAVDPRGLAVGGFDITANISMRTSQNYLNASIDTLRELADNTDGRAIVNRNDLAGA
jgi:VWFA-related protein